MSTLYLFYKPYQVLSQFSDDKGRTTLADYIKVPNIYPAGRLDYDSEGLLLLTDEGALQARITEPKYKLPKTYWVQVEGQITDEALEKLRKGVELNDGMTRPAKAAHFQAPAWLPERPEAVQPRPGLGTSWIELTLLEGRNRQVRRMTATVGFPTLRLVRYAIGTWTLDFIKVGRYRTTEVHMPVATASVVRKPSTKNPTAKTQTRKKSS
ncbi:23S rRNA pseudouridine2457 synthase [Allopseudospirillum japonicum]|uniref:Pseudouridine synthase n=1 Tax=Allopseudospirillum japonicum TaxID=64971 RepID=A0A1H6SV89_9GAMM|nr:pseudouridine synthase [Allopseudospirillum japonicum]SEI71868.1 23S rRNA pseudouridine2457 synthase [Allopseudospirillum japonicum]